MRKSSVVENNFSQQMWRNGRKVTPAAISGEILDEASIINELNQQMQVDRELDNAGDHDLSLLTNPGITRTGTTWALWGHECEAT